METQQLVDLGKQMNLEGEELREFVRAEQALARQERRKMKRGLLRWNKQRGLRSTRRKMKRGLL